MEDSLLPGTLQHSLCQLAQIEPSHKFMDFACGSGGLLINHPSSNYEEIWGIEISPEWAKLARANLLLHGFCSSLYSEPKLHIYDQNALRAFETEVNYDLSSIASWSVHLLAKKLMQS